MNVARNIHVQGIVQGVGFRPYVYRLAVKHNLAGWVLNASDGVHIQIKGEQTDAERFIEQLPLQAPGAANISSIEVSEQATGHLGPVPSVPSSPGGQGDGSSVHFEIRESAVATGLSTFISPDLATCDDCLRELFNENDRRYHYPFINCTNCGPRFTIIDALPYDRPNTSMADFEMCASCAAEYADPADRRFHAQPDACFDCGPELSLWTLEQQLGTDPQCRLTSSDSIIAQAVELLEQGKIVAIKGLGGYHLACDATNEQAVQTLRQRKRRSNKALAVMVWDIAQIEQDCCCSEAELAVLTSPAHPIVLLRLQGVPGSDVNQKAIIAPAVANGLLELGIMLPYTPLQHLLMRAFAKPLVMTSGNISEEPIIGQDQEAHQLLASVADAFLDNNRPIVSRYDDSVVRVFDGTVDFAVQMIRRARGYAPTPLQLPDCRPENILACGSEQKSTFCLTNGNTAFVSQHLGDLDNANSFINYLETSDLYKRLFNIEPEVLVCDKHPEYLSTKWAIEQARQQNIPLIQVQHHHAHIAAVLAENLDETKSERPLLSRPLVPNQVIGVVFDGTGYGDDGKLWGGEFLIANLAGFERHAHFEYMPLPGGEAAIKHPNRLAYALLHKLGLTQHLGAKTLVSQLSSQDRKLIEQMVSQQINTPQSSSVGRLFDVVSAICGICTEATYDGEPAIALGAAVGGNSIEHHTDNSYDYNHDYEDSELVIKHQDIIAGILDDLLASQPTVFIAQKFHNTIAEIIKHQSSMIRDQTEIDTVALSGGVFMNRYLYQRVVILLQQAGFKILQHRDLPPNDGCIAYGQAVVAAAQLAERLD